MKFCIKVANLWKFTNFIFKICISFIETIPLLLDLPMYIVIIYIYNYIYTYM